MTILISCPLIEDFSIGNCIGFKTIEVASSVKLIKRLNIYKCFGLERIHMVEDSPARLESFSYDTKDYFPARKASYCEININLASRKSLKSLILAGIHITEEWFRNQVSEFVSLENLSLRYCKTFMKNMCISNKHLKCLELLKCGPLEGIDISVSGLESFECDNEKVINVLNNPLNLKLGKFLIRDCTFLKNLTLKSVKIKDRLIRDNFLSSGFIFLEDLKFQSCKFKVTSRFKLYFANLKSLQLWFCDSVHIWSQKVEIESPNSVSFIYTGDFLTIPPVGLMSSNRHISSNVRFYVNHITRFDILTGFLSPFGHCNTLLLFIDDYPLDLIYPKHLRSSTQINLPLYELKHLKIRVKFKSTNIVELVDGLLYLVPHPETICFINGSRFNPKVQSKIKFYYGTPPSEVNEDSATCCSLTHLKCWRHDLTEVAMENFEDISRRYLQSYFTEKSKARITII